jgi:hypothetical protein
MIAEEGGISVPLFLTRGVARRKGCSGYSPRAQNFAFDFEQLTCKKK